VNGALLENALEFHLSEADRIRSLMMRCKTANVIASMFGDAYKSIEIVQNTPPSSSSFTTSADDDDWEVDNEHVDYYSYKTTSGKRLRNTSEFKLEDLSSGSDDDANANLRCRYPGVDEEAQLIESIEKRAREKEQTTTTIKKEEEAQPKKVKKQRTRQPRKKKVIDPNAPINMNGYNFEHAMRESPENLQERLVGLRVVIETLNRDRSTWLKPVPEKGEQGDGEAKKQKKPNLPNKKFSCNTYNQHFVDWVDTVTNVITACRDRTFHVFVDSESKERRFRGPFDDCEESDSPDIVQTPKDNRCISCRRFFITIDPSRCKPLTFTLCQCEKRRASLCVRCRVIQWATLLPVDTESGMVQPFDESGNIRQVECLGSSCKTKWCPADLFVVEFTKRVYEK